MAGPRVDVGAAVDPVRKRGAPGHLLDHGAELRGVDGGAELEQLGDLRHDGGISLVDRDQVARLQHLEEVRLLEVGGEVLAHLGLDRAEPRVVAQRGHHAVGVGLRGGVRSLRIGEDGWGENRRVDDRDVRLDVRGVAGYFAVGDLLTLGSHTQRLLVRFVDLMPAVRRGGVVVG